jgi:hypothetical protein
MDFAFLAGRVMRPRRTAIDSSSRSLDASQMALNIPLSRAQCARAAPSFLPAIRSPGAGPVRAIVVVARAAPGTMHGSFHTFTARRREVARGGGLR